MRNVSCFLKRVQIQTIYSHIWESYVEKPQRTSGLLHWNG